jgi:benzoyl-CoA reductase/2-hydroxyglutaryl-CoA dehydratase subunit BcrC/BadD/HgdB
MTSRLKDAFTDLAELQQRHLTILADETAVPDTAAMLFERRRAFANLKAAVAAASPAAIARCADRYARIRATDDEIRLHIEALQQQLMQRIQRGATVKKVLAGYRPAGGAGNVATRGGKQHVYLKG